MFDVRVANALGRKFRDLDMSYRVEGLRARIEDVKARHTASRMDDVSFTRRSGDVVHADITISPLFDAHQLIGVVVYAIDATEQARLKEQTARIAEQHATAIEELQSTNEELETTNEELQSTNEELETTNEELQSTNEELETTVEELQAANSELGLLNAQLETRSIELNRLDAYHRGLLNSIEQSIFVTDRSLLVTGWNQASERLWGLRAEQVMGRELMALPLGEAVRMLRPAVDTALKQETTSEVHDVPYTLPGGEVRKATVRVTLLRDALGGIIGLLGIAVPAEAVSGGKRR
jgi:two-component system CheB/CheR fusion protein